MVQIASRFRIQTAKSRIAALERNVAQARNEILELKPVLRKSNRIKREFARVVQVRTHRSHGWLTNLERLQIYYFAKGGISVNAVANKFAVSEPTVYKYIRSGGF